MRLIVMTFITLAVAAVTGFGSAWLALRELPLTGVVHLGQWRAWPGVGNPSIDPYARAIVQRSGALPLGTGEGIELVADADSDGRPLSGNCVYVITGPTPEARIWTLTATPLAPHVDSKLPLAAPEPSTSHGTATLTSEGLLRGAGGALNIAVAATPEPGAWLAAPPGAPFRLMLRLYDSPTGFTMRANVTDQVTPAIRRRSCS